jgi:hypothetical protein
VTGATDVDPATAAEVKRLWDWCMETPAPDPSLDASYVCYNLRGFALSFDFPYWFVAAEMRRRRLGGKAPLKVGFWAGEDGEAGLSLAYRHRMLNNVVRPMLRLIGAIEDPKAVRGWAESIVTSKPIVEAYVAGEHVPLLHAPYSIAHEFFKPPVVITLREEEGYAAHKNSLLPVWIEFADWLKARGEDVVFIRDGRFVVEPVPGHALFPQGYSDVVARMALYEAAKMCFFVSNGPVTLGFFGAFSWAAFIFPEPDDSDYPANRYKTWADYMGVPVGTQMPWSGPRQKIVWERESFDGLVKIWKEFFEK